MGTGKQFFTCPQPTGGFVFSCVRTAFRLFLHPLYEFFFRDHHAVADVQSGKVFFLYQPVYAGWRYAQSFCYFVGASCISLVFAENGENLLTPLHLLFPQSMRLCGRTFWRSWRCFPYGVCTPAAGIQLSEVQGNFTLSLFSLLYLESFQRDYHQAVILMKKYTGSVQRRSDPACFY